MDSIFPPHPCGNFSASPGVSKLQKGRLSAVANEIVRTENTCLLMFSGGRDSSLAAIRLHKANSPLVLVTVTSEHLNGLDLVRRRLSELSVTLPAETPWINVRQPSELRTDMSFYSQTCLPCHHAYVVISGAIAKAIGVRRLAFGYAGYQSSWPEQTPLAVASLQRVLGRHDIALELPVYDLNCRDDARNELRFNGLSIDSLEQKCLRQVTNVTLKERDLEQQVALWEMAIDESMSQVDSIDLEILTFGSVGSPG
jgi:hypothetical protein